LVRWRWWRWRREEERREGREVVVDEEVVEEWRADTKKTAHTQTQVQAV